LRAILYSLVGLFGFGSWAFMKVQWILL
jgi:hypothetical protein